MSADRDVNGAAAAALDSAQDSNIRQPAERIRAHCDYCGSSDALPVTEALVDDEGRETLPPAFQNERFQLVRCSNCNLVYLAERPSLLDLDVYYPDNYMCFQSYSERGRIMQWLADRVARSKLKEIRRLMPPSSHALLDYGCGSGTWLTHLRRLGCEFEMLGMDVVESPLEQLRAAGIAAHCCDENSMFDHVQRETVGVIHLFHVIEHVPSPKRVLAQLKEALVPGGAIIGQTPNIASAGCRFWGSLWNQWHVPRHFVMFDHDTLRRHAEAVGLEVVAVRSSLSGATQWAHGFCKWRAKRGGRAFRGIQEPLYPFLIFAFLPVAVAESIFAHTCHMDFVFRRPLSS